MTESKPFFLDTNVLIRGTVNTAPLYDETKQVLEKLWVGDADLWISQQILREYLANVTRPQTFMNAMPIATAIARIEYFQSRFIVAQDNDRVFAALLKLLSSISTGGKQVHDTNIIATMQTYGVSQLLTYNPSDFMRFSAHITVLSPQDLLKNTEE